MRYNKVLLIDGSNMIHRQLRQPNMWELSYNGVRTGGVFGFMRSVQTVLSKYPDHYPVVVFDHGRSPRRLAIYPNYKHQADQDKERAEKKRLLESGAITFEESQDEYLNELIRQSGIIKDLLKMFKIPVVQVPKWEGDDIITIISRECKDCVVVTEDKDMYQLLTPTCRIMRPMRENEDGTRGKEITYEEMKHPTYGDMRYFTITKSIVGDPSDNIPKVAQGIGGVTANKIAEIMLQYNENAEQFLPVLTEMGKKYAVFAQNYEEYVRNSQLVDLGMIEQDPYIIEKLDQAVAGVTDGSTPNMIAIMQALSANGITKLDFSRLMTSVMTAQKGLMNNG